MPFHFHIPSPTPPQTGQRLTLSADRSNYVTRVLRIRKGERVRCFDGAGCAFYADLIKPSTRDAQLEVTEVSPAKPLATPSLCIGMCMIKGPGQDRAIAAATELGAQQILLLNSDRTNVKLDQTRLENKMSHWQKVAIGAAEQCGRLYVPEISHADLEGVFQDGLYDNITVLDAQGSSIPSPVVPQDRLVLIGPEGGWSENELQLFNHKQIEMWSIGDLTLRAETVPAVILALLQF